MTFIHNCTLPGTIAMAKTVWGNHTALSIHRDVRYRGTNRT